MRSMLNTYRELPGELRAITSVLLVAVPLGLGAGAFALFRQMFGLSTTGALLAMLGVLVGLALLVLGILALRRWVSRRRHERMARALRAAGADRPTAMGAGDGDVREMNDKFRRAVEEMRRHGYRVYDMPWYIVVGDSGCGKTKLIDESGLQFPLGRPEEISDGGVSLGTKDYNWWFTENMIFIDMAGKLVNPQEAAGHRTWLGMLKIIARGRPACPINGALVCVSVEDLLGNPEKRRRDAENMQLRLRELQMHLGVTFPTYIIVTKCDLLPGFVEFYRKVGRDLLLRNQISGWSRPGTFNAAYDPDGFRNDFADLERRLAALRHKRLHEADDDRSLENAYCFPEHFREIGGPLHEYIVTVFPQLRNTRGVSQLLFRGVYFTSATQDDRLLSREGGVSDVLRGLEKLYEKPEPHFLKDLLQKKVAPEQGLVYRNEAQLRRNRTLAIGLGVGSVLMLVLGVWGFLWSHQRFAEIIALPREHAQANHYEKARDLSPEEALRQAALLTRDEERLAEARWAARILSTFISPDRPRRHLQRIRAGIFDRVLMPALAEQTARALEDSAAAKAGDPDDAVVAAARAFVKWHAVGDAQRGADCLTYDDFAGMARLARAPDGSGAAMIDWAAPVEPDAPSVAVAAEDRPRDAADPAIAPTTAPAAPSSPGGMTFAAVGRAWVESLKAADARVGNPAAPFRRHGADAATRSLERILTGRAQLERFGRSATAERLARYAGLARAAKAARQAYDDFLRLAQTHESARDVETADAFSAAYREIFARFGKALERVKEGEPRIEASELWTLLIQHRESGWRSVLRELTDGVSACGGRLPEPIARLDAELDARFATTLGDVGVAKEAFAVADLPTTGTPRPPDTFVGLPGERLRNILNLGDGGRLTWTVESEKVRDRLAAYDAHFAAAASADPLPLAALDEAIRATHAALLPAGSEDRPPGAGDPLRLRPTLSGWDARELQERGDQVYAVAWRLRATRILRALVAQAPAQREWGVAEVCADWNVPLASVYTMSFSRGTAAPTTQPRLESSGDSRVAGPDDGPVSDAPAPTERAIPRAATSQFLGNTAVTTALLLDGLAKIPGGLFDATIAEKARAQLEDGFGVYARSYAAAWRKAVDTWQAPVLAPDQDAVMPAPDRRAEWSGAVAQFAHNVLRAGFYERDATSGTGYWIEHAASPGSFAPLARPINDNLNTLFAGLRVVRAKDDRQLPFADVESDLRSAWGDLQRDLEAAVAARDGRTAAPAGGSPFGRFGRFRERFGWSELPALRAAVTYEVECCKRLADGISREIASAATKPLSERCRELPLLQSRAEKLNEFLGGCGGVSVGADVKRVCELRAMLSAATVEIEPLTEDFGRSQVTDLNNRLATRFPGRKQVNVADCTSQFTLTVGSESVTIRAGSVYEALKRQPVSGAGRFSLQFVPKAGVTLKPAGLDEPFADPPVHLIAFIHQNNEPASEGRRFDFVTIHAFEVTREGNQEFCFLGIGWKLTGVSGPDLRDYLGRLP